MAAVETPAQDERPAAMPRPKRWTGAEYDRVVEMGLFDHQRLELIRGEVLEMSPMNDVHAQGITLVHYALLRVFPAERFTVRVQCPMRLGADSRPEPDLAVVSGAPREQASHPTTALLVVEVSDTSLDFDRSQKASLYARHRIAEYWVVDLSERRLEVRRDPVTDDAGSRYRSVQVLTATDRIAPLAAPSGEIAVRDLLP